MVGDAVPFHQRDEIVLRVAAQRRLGEMRILREEVARAGTKIGEVAATAARDADLLAGRLRMIEHEHASAARSRMDSAHHARSARAEDDRVEILGPHRSYDVAIVRTQLRAMAMPAASACGPCKAASAG